MRAAIGVLLVAACSEPKPVAVAAPPAIDIAPLDAGPPAIAVATLEDASAPIATDDCKAAPCLVTSYTVDISASGTELWFVTSAGGGAQALVQRRREDGIDRIASPDLRPSHIAHVYRIRGDEEAIAAATTDGVEVFDKRARTQRLLAADPSEAFQVALDSTAIYWMNGACALKKVDRASGKITALATTGEKYCSLPHIAVDASDVYFAADATVYAVSKNGGPARIVHPKTNSYLLGLEVDDANAYLFLSPKTSQDGSIVRVPKRGGKGTKLQDVSAPGNAYTMTSDDQRLYWLESKESRVVVASMTKPAGIRVVLAETAGLAYGISVGTDSVYWVRWVMGGGTSNAEVFRIFK